MIKPKRVTPRYILIKMAKTKDKDKILKAIREYDVINKLSSIKISLIKKSSKGSHKLRDCPHAFLYYALKKPALGGRQKLVPNNASKMRALSRQKAHLNREYKIY